MDTKRKIEESLALLNSIIAHPNKKQSTGHQTSNTSTDSLSGSAPEGASPAAFKKRVYLPPRPAVLDKLSRLSSSRPTLRDSIAASIAASSPTANSGSSDPTTPASNSSSATPPCVAGTNEPLNSSKKKYMPWSREQFHERLETFKPSTWFDKPKIVSPVECAKRGWINKGNDRLECFGGCGGVVIVRVDQDQRKTDHKQNQDSAENDDDDEDEDTNDMLYELGIEDTESDRITREQIPRRSHSGFNGPNSSNRVDMDEDDVMEEEDEVAFDVVQSHKWYCYWVNTEQDSSHKEGWRTLFERLTYASTGKVNEADGSAEMQQSEGSTAKIEPKEALAQVRRILRGQAAPSTPSAPSSSPIVHS
ncbi:hypothetical protein BGX26_010270 [Mortierella sp. AD094]|nr:hypothetical protein BGX26_010270 [Mortierella sp. AD094]